MIYGTAKYYIDLKEREGAGASDLNVKWTLSGELVNMLTAPYKSSMASKFTVC